MKTLSDERRRLVRAQARLAELENARRRGELFDATVALQAWSGMVTAFRAQALALPRALADVLVHVAPHGPAAVEAKLSEAIRDCLTTLAGWQPPAAEGAPAKIEGPPHPLAPQSKVRS